MRSEARINFETESSCESGSSFDADAEKGAGYGTGAAWIEPSKRGSLRQLTHHKHYNQNCRRKPMW